MHKQTILILLLIMITAYLPGEAPDQEFEAFIERALTEYKVPGAAVAIVKDGKIVYIKGFGIQRYGHPEKITPEKLFQLASVSKTFTAAAVGAQVDRKKFGWDDQVIRHLPQAILHDIYAARYASPRDYLAHRSGLPAFQGDLLGRLGLTRDEILERVQYIEPSTSFREKAQY